MRKRGKTSLPFAENCRLPLTQCGCDVIRPCFAISWDIGSIGHGELCFSEQLMMIWYATIATIPSFSRPKKMKK